MYITCPGLDEMCLIEVVLKHASGHKVVFTLQPCEWRVLKHKKKQNKKNLKSNCKKKKSTLFGFLNHNSMWFTMWFRLSATWFLYKIRELYQAILLKNYNKTVISMRNGKTTCEVMWRECHIQMKWNEIKSNQITFIVTSPQHKCLGEWNSWERAPNSAKKQTIYI